MMDASGFLALVERRLGEMNMKAATASRLAVGNPYLIRNMQKAVADPEVGTPRMPSFEHLQALCRVLGLEFYIGPPRDSAAPLPPDLLESIARAAAGSPLSLDRLVRAVIFAEVGLASRGATFSPAKKGQLVAAIYQLLTMDPHNEAMIQRLVDLAAAA